MAKTKQIVDRNFEFLREVPLTEKELAMYANTDEVYQIDVGDGTVICDYCDKDYTNSNETGGFTFGSCAVCPGCAPRIEANAIKYNEAQYIKYRCPPDMSYANWVRDILRKNHAEEHTSHVSVLLKKENNND